MYLIFYDKLIAQGKLLFPQRVYIQNHSNSERASFQKGTHSFKHKEADTKYYIVYDSIYTQSKTRQVCSVRSVVARLQVRGDLLQRATREISRMMQMFVICHDCDNSYMIVYMCQISSNYTKIISEFYYISIFQ